MANLRLQYHPVTGEGFAQVPEVVIEIDGRSVAAREGECLAAVFLNKGYFEGRHVDSSGKGKGIYCGMGHCYECAVTVDGVENIRSCLTPVRKGMKISLNQTNQNEAME